MGILRRQEKRLAIRLLSWQYKRVNLSLPAIEELERQADRLVDDAHRIAFLPAIPHQVSLFRTVVNPTSLFHFQHLPIEC